MSHTEESSSSRWWEFYAIRYGMGSVVGGVIFFVLCLTNPALKPLLFGTEGGKIDATQLVLLAGYGLTYCYIASAPILVLHVGRFLLDVRVGGGLSGKRVFAFLAPPLVATGIFFFSQVSDGPVLYFFSVVFLLAALIVWSQYLVVGFSLFKSKELFEFYQKLSNKRSGAKGGFVDSYKHMREHGNSFSIVLLEIVLAILLFAWGNFDAMTTGIVSSSKATYVIPYLVVVLLWILPAALVWLVGTLLERQFSDDS